MGSIAEHGNGTADKGLGKALRQATALVGSAALVEGVLVYALAGPGKALVAAAGVAVLMGFYCYGSIISVARLERDHPWERVGATEDGREVIARRGYARGKEPVLVVEPGTLPRPAREEG